MGRAMKKYLYQTRENACGGQCQSGVCGEKCTSLLREMCLTLECETLPAGALFKSAASMCLRSGDLVVLYAGNQQELDELIDMREVFEPFRIILIIGTSENIDESKYYQLNPRYITFLEENMNGLEAVIRKMESLSYTP